MSRTHTQNELGDNAAAGIDALPCDLIRTISSLDTMLDPGREDVYFRIGRNALEICKHILRGRAPELIIDYGCGFGRGLRWFRNEWPAAKVYAVDIDGAALDFVASTFQAIPIQGDPHFKIELPAHADLIFSGSLLTHLDDWQWDPFINSAINSLSPEGMFVFTTHGRLAAMMARDRHPLYGTLVDTAELYERYKSQGFAFLPYSRDYPTFGLTLSSPEWIMRRLQQLARVKIVNFHEGGWGQDVVALQRIDFNLVED